jgi:hypothetical protein
VAAIYYAITLREARKSRHMQLLLQTIHDLQNEEGYNRYVTLMNMEWKDTMISRRSTGQTTIV